MNKNLLIASDHAGYDLKKALIDNMDENLFEDLGTNSNESVDYPDYAIKVINIIKKNPSKKGVLICGSGIGMSIAANRHYGIRAALCFNSEMAELTRKHNDANILVLPGRFMDINTAKSCIDNFINTDFDGNRHINRLKKIDNY